MSKIDDPIDTSFEAFPEEPEGLGGKFAELALSFTGLVFPPAAVLKILTDQFRPAKRVERIEYLLRGLSIGIKALDTQGCSDREKMKEIQARIEGPKFQEGVAAACEEAVRATIVKKVELLAQVVAGSLTPTRWSPKDEDVATLIRTFCRS